MNSPQLGLRVAGVLFGLMCIAHLGRLVLKFQVLLGSHPVPVWLNGVGFVVTGLLAYWLLRLSLPAKPAGTPPAA